MAIKIVKFLSYFLLALVSGLLFVFDGFYVLPKGQSTCNAYSANNSDTGAYVINLDKSPGRYEYILPNLKLLDFPFHRISATDGSKLTEDEIAKYIDYNKYKQYIGYYPDKGTVGCYLSHVKVWKEFLASGFEYALIFEDDVSFDPDLVNKVITDLKEKKNLWDIAMLEKAHSGMPLTLGDLARSSRKLVSYLTEVSHTGGYIISRKAASLLLEKAFPIMMPVDHFLSRNWEFELKLTGVEPTIVFQSFGDSDISKTAILKESENTLSLLGKLKRASYRLKSYVIRFFYNLITYLKANS